MKMNTTHSDELIDDEISNDLLLRILSGNDIQISNDVILASETGNIKVIQGFMKSGYDIMKCKGNSQIPLSTRLYL